MRRAAPFIFFLGLALLCANLVAFSVYPAAYAQASRDDLVFYIRTGLPDFGYYAGNGFPDMEEERLLSERVARADTDTLVGFVTVLLVFGGLVQTLRRRWLFGLICLALGAAICVLYVRSVPIDWSIQSSLNVSRSHVAMGALALAGALFAAIGVRFSGLLIVVAVLSLATSAVSRVWASFQVFWPPCFGCCTTGNTFWVIADQPRVVATIGLLLTVAAAGAWFAHHRFAKRPITAGALFAALTALAMVSVVLAASHLAPELPTGPEAAATVHLGKVWACLSGLVLLLAVGLMLASKTSLLVSHAVSWGLFVPGLALLPLSFATIHDVALDHGQPTATCWPHELSCEPRGVATRLRAPTEGTLPELEVNDASIGVNAAARIEDVTAILQDHAARGGRRVMVSAVVFEPGELWLRDTQRARSFLFSIEYAENGIPLSSFSSWADVVEAARATNSLRLRPQ